MNQPSPQRPILPTRPPIVADGARDGSGREEAREFVRDRPREPHEKYDLGRSNVPRGMTFQWVSTRIPYTTLRNPRLDSFRGAGWQFARAEDFPEHSGYKPTREVNQRLIDLGIDSEVRADDPVVKDNLVLMMRPKQLSAEAEGEQREKAARQINDHLRRQRELSERQIGAQRTTMRKSYAPAEAPSDQDTEI